MPPLALPRKCRIAVFLQLETEHGRGLLRGIAQFSRQRPEVTVLKFSRSEGYRESDLRAIDADGIIAKVASAEDERVLRKTRIPVINISGHRITPRLPTVNTDDLLVGRMAARHLLSRGYRHLAFCGEPGHLASRLRGEGFSAAAREAGASPVKQLATGPALRGEWERQLRNLPRPLGIFAFTDQVAIDLAEACATAGWEIPQAVAILGVGNDLTRLGFAAVDISSIQLNTARIGQLAAEMLWQWLQGTPAPLAPVLLPPVKLVTRASTDLVAVSDDAVADALGYIRDHAGNLIYVDEVARAVGVSRRVLEMKFRKHLRSSVYEEVQRTHFERARELLHQPDLTVGEVAFASGFQSAQRFSTAFRRRYGQAPAHFRAQVRTA